MNKLHEKLRTEDWICLFYASVTGLFYLYSYLTDQGFYRADSMVFYYFLLPFFLIVFREILFFFFSSNPAARPIISTIRDWFPFLLILAMYYSFYDGLDYFISRENQDTLLFRIENSLFGFQPVEYLQQFRSVFLDSLMSFSYLSFFLLPPLTALVIYWRKDFTSFRIMMISIVITQFFGCLSYLLVPAVGPLHAFPYLVSGADSGIISDFTVEFINIMRLPRDCFPSLHAGLTVVSFLSAGIHSKKFLYLLFLPTVLLCISCIYLGYHYAIDVISGILLAVSVFYLVKRFFSVRFLFSVLKQRHG